MKAPASRLCADFGVELRSSNESSKDWQTRFCGLKLRSAVETSVVAVGRSWPKKMLQKRAEFGPTERITVEIQPTFALSTVVHLSVPFQNLQRSQ